MMPQIAKALGQFLGPRNKMPRPITGDIETMVNNATKSIYIRSRGKNLPTVHCMVGTETMQINELASNIDAVLSEVIRSVGKQSVRSVYLKLTMSQPLKIM
jgi:large subunit ribosomal protein L1